MRHEEPEKRVKPVKHANRANRANGEKHAKHANLVNRANGAKHANRVNRANGVKHSSCVNRANGVKYASCVNRANGEKHANRVNRANGEKHTKHANRVNRANGAKQASWVNRANGEKHANRANRVNRANGEKHTKHANRVNRANGEKHTKHANRVNRANGAKQASWVNRVEKWRLMFILVTLGGCLGLVTKAQSAQSKARVLPKSKRALSSDFNRMHFAIFAAVQNKPARCRKLARKLRARRGKAAAPASLHAAASCFRGLAHRHAVAADHLERKAQRKKHRSGRQKRVFERKIAKLRRRARKAYEKAHTLYGRLSGLPAFSKYPKAAQALLESGWVAGQLAALLVSKRKTTRRKALLTKQRHAIMRLLKNYPRSQHIPQAYYVFAHTLFRQKAFSKAVAVLSKVTQYRRAPVAPYAACLLGRVYLALNNHVKALSQFVKVARRKGLRPEVRRTALLGVVKSYVRVGRPDKAYAFFLRCHHKPDVRTTKIMLRLLAALYRAAHKNRQAETILRVLSRR